MTSQSHNPTIMIVFRTRSIKLEFIPTLLMVGFVIERDFRYTNIAFAIPFFIFIIEIKRDWRAKLF